MPQSTSNHRAPVLVAIPVALALASHGLDAGAFGFAGRKPREAAAEARTVLAEELTTEQRQLVEEHVYGGLVPPMFFSIVVRQPDPDQTDDLPEVLAFLFPHQRQAHGDIEDFLVTVDVIEALTGLDFFHELADPVETVLEDTDTIVNWPRFEASPA